MFVYIFSLLLIPAFSADSTPVCDRTTKVSTEEKVTIQEFNIGGQLYSLRKGPKYCYIDAKVVTITTDSSGKEKIGDISYPMLEACDSVVANPKLGTISCTQKNDKKINFNQADLENKAKEEMVELRKDICATFLAQPLPSINSAGSTRDRRFADTLNGDIELGESVMPGGQCTLKVPGSMALLECDKVYKLSGNKYSCVYGYEESTVTGRKSDGTVVLIDDLLDSTINLCNNTGNQIFRDLPTEKSTESDDFTIVGCRLQSGKTGDIPCNQIILEKKAGDNTGKFFSLNCTTIPSKDDDGKFVPSKVIELATVTAEAREEMYRQFFKSDSVTIEALRTYVNRKIFHFNSKEAENNVMSFSGVERVREGARKPRLER